MARAWSRSSCRTFPTTDCGLRLRRLREAFGDRAYMALTLRRRPNDQLRLHELANLAARLRVPTVVTNDVLFHEPGRRILQDVVTCIRHNVTIDALGDRRERHADRYLKPPEEMHRLFGRYPGGARRARWRSSSDAASRSTNSPTSIPRSATIPHSPRSRPWRS